VIKHSEIFGNKEHATACVWFDKAVFIHKKNAQRAN